MLIDFGWTADGSAWAGARGGAAQGQVRMGPRALVQLLQTRLGLTRPAVDQAVRIAQYMVLIQQHLAAVPEPASFWPQRSFAVDPWSTARQLLRWRDAAIEAGWAPAAVPAAPLSPRIAALREVEAHVVVGMPGTTDAAGRPATLSPSAADDLVEVLALLEELESTGGTWPLGITELSTQEDPAVLPGLWPRLLSVLSRSGVRVHGPVGTTGPGAARACSPRIEVVSCQDEWTAVDVAARYLSAPPTPGEGRLTVLAGADTTVLDQALARRGLPAVGAVERSTDRAHHQVLSLFLDVAIAPVDVHQLAALLDLRVLPGADGDAEPVGLVPAAARRRLLRALTEQPGVGGPAWQQALRTLAEQVTAVSEERRPGAQRALEAAREIDRLVSNPLPSDQLLPPAISSRLDWLATRLRSVARGDGDLLASLTQVQTLQGVLGMLDPGTALPRRTLQQIIDACGGSGSSPLAGPEVAPWAVSTRPAQLAADGGTVLWWAPEGGESPPAVQWSRDERDALEASGAHLIEPEAQASLHIGAALRGLRTAGTVVAILPGRRAEKAPSPSGLLAHLEAGAGRTEKDRLSPASLLSDSDVGDGRLTWSLAGRTLPVRMPALRTVDPPQEAHRSLGDAAHLLPQRLSFTAAQTLVGCPLHWLLEYALEVRPADVAALPTGDRMIGTLVHAIVESLVTERFDHSIGGAAMSAPTDAEITAAFDRLVPQFASELDLPGHASQRADAHSRTLRSLRELFRRTAAAGLRITGTEVRFNHPLTLQLARGPRTVEFRGSRDMDLRDDRGRPMVIDLKWSRSRTRYGDLYDTGDAVQLASYAWSLEQDGPLAQPADVGYFLLHAGEFISANRELDTHRRSPMDVRASWDRLVTAITTALDEIADGRATAGCRTVLDAAGLGPDADYSRRKKAMTSARDAARAAGTVAMDSYCATSDYAQLCGMTGDFR